MKGAPCPVRVAQTGKVYPSLKQALEDLGIQPCGSSYRRFSAGYPVKGWLIDPIKVGDPDWHKCQRRQMPQNRSRPVRCVETGQIYKSGTQAALAVYVVKNSIYQAIYKGYRAGGYHWEWADITAQVTGHATEQVNEEARCA